MKLPIILLLFTLTSPCWAEEVTVKIQGPILTQERAKELIEFASQATDIPALSLKVTIEIYKTRREMENKFRQMFNTDLPADIPSYYVANTKTVVANKEEYSEARIVHELTHAIIANYFVVAMPPKTQEILCRSAEFQFRQRKTK